MRSKKWLLIYTASIIALVVSEYYFTLPLESKLRLFCTMDKAHIAESVPAGVYPHFTNPTTGTRLTVFTIFLMVDGSTFLYYDYQENIFWIEEQTGPRRVETYGPYPGILWELTKAIDPLAILGITLSLAVFFYPLMGRALRHNIEEIKLFRKRK